MADIIDTISCGINSNRYNIVYNAENMGIMEIKKEKKPIIVYDDDITDEVEYRMENKEDFGCEEMDEEMIRDEICNDSMFWQDRWDFMLEYLTEQMEKIMKRYKSQGYWKAEVKGFGWRNQTGTMDIFSADDGRELLNKILPDCDCHFQIYRTRTGFKINNFHHDSPIGEWYYVQHATKKELEEEDGY